MSLPDAPDSTLPLVLYKAALAQVLRRSKRSVERLDEQGGCLSGCPFLAGRPGRVTWC